MAEDFSALSLYIRRAMDLCANTACQQTLPAQTDRCPHCGFSAPPPNVRAANHPDEIAALEGRYVQACDVAGKTGCTAVADALIRAAGASRAVIARPLGEIERLARSDHEVFSTYYKQIEADLRLPDTNIWDPLRRIAEESLFPGYKDQIRFAALTLDDRGLTSYGNCFFTLRTLMIAERATVFEENNVLFMRKRDLRFSQLVDLPRGHRATWDNRAKLCLAKLVDALTTTTGLADFPALLLRQGATSGDDDFVEVHVWGPITIRAIEKIVLVNPETGPVAEAKRRTWAEFLKSQYGIMLEVV